MAAAVGRLRLTLDFGTQSNMNGSLLLAFPNDRASRALPWADLDRTNAYSMFGVGGGGFGGVDIKGLRTHSVRHLHVYPGSWVHSLKAFSLPQFPVKFSTNRWFSSQRQRMHSFSAYISQLPTARLAGIRLEFLIQFVVHGTSSSPSWIRSSGHPHSIHVTELSVSAALVGFVAALQSATDAGLWTCNGTSLGTPALPWRRNNYARLYAGRCSPAEQRRCVLLPTLWLALGPTPK